MIKESEAKSGELRSKGKLLVMSGIPPFQFVTRGGIMTF